MTGRNQSSRWANTKLPQHNANRRCGSAGGGIPDIVRPGETGWLVPPGDPEAIADAVLEIARDPASALGIARKGRRFVEERFSLERVVAEVTEVYRSAIRARREARG